MLSGGVGGARFLQGLPRRPTGLAPGGPRRRVTVIANTADDIWVHGLKICPDLDTVMYTLGDGIDPERGWGRRDETWHAKDELAAYGVEPTWFGLGDRDLATHLVRTQMLEAVFAMTVIVASGSPGVTSSPVRTASWRPCRNLAPPTPPDSTVIARGAACMRQLCRIGLEHLELGGRIADPALTFGYDRHVIPTCRYKLKVVRQGHRDAGSKGRVP